MAVFNDLAVELQEAIWKLVLPSCRGVHWVEVEGHPCSPDLIRDGIHWTQAHNFGVLPETVKDVKEQTLSPSRDEFMRRLIDTDTSVFFSKVFTTVPAVFGLAGSDDNTPNHEDNKEQKHGVTDEIAYTRRCRQLSTYYQITTLLSTCRLSRHIALQYLNRWCTMPLHRSLGALYRPRPMEVWEAQYSNGKSPSVSKDVDCWEVLRPQIHINDLVIFRLHDIQGRATSLLRHAAWQYYFPYIRRGFGCFSRVGLEWNPYWGTTDGRDELRPGNVGAIMNAMTCFWVVFYWLVDGVPRPDWKRDYPAVVEEIFAERMNKLKHKPTEHFDKHWDLNDAWEKHLSSDHHLGQEFEANGRRYYIVFVVESDFNSWEQKKKLYKTGLGFQGPFPGSAALWPEALRAPVYRATELVSGEMPWPAPRQSIILSWEPVH